MLSLTSFFDRQGIPESLVRNRVQSRSGRGSQDQLDQDKEEKNREESDGNEY